MSYVSHTESRSFMNDDDDETPPPPFPNGDVGSHGWIHCHCVQKIVKHESKGIIHYERLELEEDEVHYDLDVSKSITWFMAQCAKCDLAKLCRRDLVRFEGDEHVTMTSGASFDELMQAYLSAEAQSGTKESGAVDIFRTVYFGSSGRPFAAPIVWHGRDLSRAKQKRLCAIEPLDSIEQRQRFSGRIGDLYRDEPFGLGREYAVAAPFKEENTFGYHWGTATAEEAVLVGRFSAVGDTATVYIDVIVGEPGRGRGLIQCLINDCGAKSSLSDQFMQCSQVEIKLESVPARFWTYACLGFDVTGRDAVMFMPTNNEYEDPTLMAIAAFNALSEREKKHRQASYNVNPDGLYEFCMRKACHH